jgi:hypothetical protein
MTVSEYSGDALSFYDDVFSVLNLDDGLHHFLSILIVC